MVIDTPTIAAGTSKIYGRIIIPEGTNKNNVFVNVTVSQPISGEYVKHKTLVDQFGKFSMNVEVETTISLISLFTTINPEKPLLLKLTSGGVTSLDITYNSANDIKNIDVIPTMNQNDMTQGFEVINKMIEYRPDRGPKRWYDKSTDDFMNHTRIVMAERLAIFNNYPLISKEIKDLLSEDFRMFMYVSHVFPYEKEMIRNYHNTSDDKNAKPEIQKIDRSYYGFLKDFKLSHSQYLNCLTFQEFQNEILQNEILAIPVIGESDIPSWLAKVKGILSDLVGFDDGLYYDVLTANAYAKQLHEEVKPLTEKQKENIEKYWKNGEIAKILFRKNQKIIELNKFKSPTVVNDISNVPGEKVIETIIAKNKGKVIFVDFWATWCGPCLDAMQQFRSTKDGFRGKEIVFVYLTDGSSPRKLWEEKIKGIGDEHYYLTGAQWEYIMNHFGFEYIPSYLLYNKKGVLINKFSAFPGAEEVKGMINSVL